MLQLVQDPFSAQAISLLAPGHFREARRLYLGVGTLLRIRVGLTSIPPLDKPLGLDRLTLPTNLPRPQNNLGNRTF